MSGDGARTVESIRADFPALERRHGAHTVAYFDGPGGTQVPRAVVGAITDYLLNHNANTHWPYPTSLETDALLGESRAAFADLFNATPRDISFGNNMTTITFHLARALARGWRAGDEIVVTELDHHANVAPWRAVAQDVGLVVRSVPFDTATFRMDWDGLSRALGPRTRLLAIGAASNALGTITDAARACAMARDAGALSFVDAVHLAPHTLLDVEAIGCDFLACSPYKFYGPHTGVLYGRESLVQSLDVPKLAPAPNEAPWRLETGTQNHEGIVGAAAAVDYLASLATSAGTRRERLARVMAALHTRGDALVLRLWNGLAAIDGVTLYGPPPGTPRTPTVAFTLAGRTTEDVARHLGTHGIFVSNGHFYAQSVAERLGLGEDGFVRAGAACYTTAEEVDRLLESVRALAQTSQRITTTAG
ncbi:MAG: cysteine desulfurase family protein [Gemmatimonadetes bacterium]|nr:cysteine desulfurase family protein [Gemmatimonadota bacterium]